jgi:mycothiol synthase
MTRDDGLRVIIQPMNTETRYELIKNLTPAEVEAIRGAAGDTYTFQALTGEALTEMLAHPDRCPEACWAARRADGPAGVALTTAGEKAGTLQLLVVTREARRQGVGRELLRRVVAATRARPLAELRTTGVDARDEAAAAFFAAAGWERSDPGGLRMRRELRNLPEDVPLGSPVSEEYFLRTLRDEDAEVFVRLINAAFATEEHGGGPWTLESFQRSFRGDPVFAPDRVFLAVRRRDGAVAGTTSSWDYTVDGRCVGLIHWVAVDPEHRGRKLGIALMIRAMHDMVARGHTEAFLNTNVKLRHAVQLYESLDFTIHERRLRYRLDLRE